jgi:hypothetical protein
VSAVRIRKAVALFLYTEGATLPDCRWAPKGVEEALTVVVGQRAVPNRLDELTYSRQVTRESRHSTSPRRGDA